MLAICMPLQVDVSVTLSLRNQRIAYAKYHGGTIATPKCCTPLCMRRYGLHAAWRLTP